MSMNKEQKKQIGLRIKKLRTELGLFQSQVAEKIGVDRVSVTNYETGRAVPTWDTLIVLAELFNTTTDYLLEGTPVHEETPDPYKNEREFLNSVFELSDSEIKERFTFKVDGRELTPEEFDRMIAAVRVDRLYKGSEK